jgi:probable HAF family extracellular repeat protein
MHRVRMRSALVGIFAVIAAINVPTYAITTYHVQGLGFLPTGNASVAYDINSNGVVVGMANTSNGFGRPFKWTQQTGMVDFSGVPMNTGASAFKINDVGKIIGGDSSLIWPTGAAPAVPSPVGRVFGLNQAGHISGDQGFNNGSATIPVPTIGFGTHTQSNAVNDSDTVAGVSTDGSAFFDAIRWTQAGGTLLLPPLIGNSGNRGRHQRQ